MTDPPPASPDPGWYADPNGDQRWWDGTGWTEQTLPPPPAPVSTPVTTTPGAGSSGGVAKTLLVGTLVLGVVLLVALAVLDVVLLVG